jgi:hypothetical protein
MSDAKPVETLIDKSIVLKKRQNELNEESDATDQHKYQEADRSINYAEIATRPDISYASSMLRRYLADSLRARWING